MVGVEDDRHIRPAPANRLIRETSPSVGGRTDASVTPAIITNKPSGMKCESDLMAAGKRRDKTNKALFELLLLTLRGVFPAAWFLLVLCLLTDSKSNYDRACVA